MHTEIYLYVWRSWRETAKTGMVSIRALMKMIGLAPSLSTAAQSQYGHLVDTVALHDDAASALPKTSLLTSLTS